MIAFFVSLFRVVSNFGSRHLMFGGRMAKNGEAIHNIMIGSILMTKIKILSEAIN